MSCPQCGSETLRPQQRFCHACGAPLSQTPAIIPTNGVGDGNKDAITGLLIPVATYWIATNRSRLIMYGAGGALAVIALVTAVTIVIAALATILTALTPLFILVALLLLASRHHRRRRRHWMWFYRF